MNRLELNELLNNSIPLPYFDSRQVLNKDRSMKQYISYMLNRTNAMFEYKNLPDTIPAYILELYLQIFGACAFTYISDTTIIPSSNYSTPPGHYIFYGNPGGERDIYYRPTLFIVANPRISSSVNCTIVYDEQHKNVDSPCVLIKNDTNMCGLLPLFSRHAAELTENDISIRSAQINARALIGICVSNDRDKETARKYLDNLEAGTIGILGETAFLEGVTVSNVSTQSSNHIIQLIELQQYLKASWYNEIGLNVNFNMKREYMSEEEIAVNTDILLPLIDDMFNNRLQAVELINSVFGLNIEVSKSSAWANKEQEDIAALSEASIAGEIPLADTISSKLIDMTDDNLSQGINNDTSIQEQEEQTSISVQTEQATETQNQMGDSGGNETLGVDGPVSQPITETIININTQQADVEVESGDVMETQTEPKESDNN